MRGQDAFVVAVVLACKALAIGSVIAVAGRAYLHHDHFTLGAVVAAAGMWKLASWLDDGE